MVTRRSHPGFLTPKALLLPLHCPPFLHSMSLHGTEGSYLPGVWPGGKAGHADSRGMPPNLGRWGRGGQGATEVFGRGLLGNLGAQEMTVSPLVGATGDCSHRELPRGTRTWTPAKHMTWKLLKVKEGEGPSLEQPKSPGPLPHGRVPGLRPDSSAAGSSAAPQVLYTHPWSS